MKSYWNVLIAGALLASTSIASQGDPFAAERFRAKTGRYQVEAANNKSCMMQCCRHKETVASRTEGNSETERLNRFFEAKLGRRLNHAPKPAPVLAKATAVPAACECPACCE